MFCQTGCEKIESILSPKTMMKSCKIVLIDLSGTLHIGSQEAAPGCIAALHRLRNSALTVKFVTNTTKEPKRLLHSKLTTIGFKVDEKEIFTSLTAANELLKRKNSSKPLLFVEDCALEDFSDVAKTDVNANNADSVVVGLAPSTFSYHRMNIAFQALLREGVPLIAVHKARYYKTALGELSLGPGPFVAALEYSSGVSAEVVGKPSRSFFHAAVAADLAGCDPASVCMIGDDVRDDVIGACDAGFSAILVQTGKYLAGDERRLADQQRALVARDFPHAVDMILEGVT